MLTRKLVYSITKSKYSFLQSSQRVTIRKKPLLNNTIIEIVANGFLANVATNFRIDRNNHSKIFSLFFLLLEKYVEKRSDCRKLRLVLGDNLSLVFIDNRGP